LISRLPISFLKFLEEQRMKLAQLLLLLIGASALVACGAQVAQAGSVSVGSSTLIGALDYSDTYTTAENGGLADRPDGAYGPAFAVENCYGNASRSWPDLAWSINTDGTVIKTDPNSPYPGASGGGSDTGVTQTGAPPNGADWGIEYGLRDRFVVQYDSVQTGDRIDLGVGPTLGSIGGDNVTLFFRPSGHSWYDVGLYHGNYGEVDTGLVSPTSADAWHNYAALFDIPARTIEVFVDETSLGVVDIDTVGGGVLAGLPFSNETVNVGGCHSGTAGWLMWTDNFQVGAPVPEPGAFVLFFGALMSLLVGRRR
jgi:hypothetical protein